MILDANLLLYAQDSSAPRHAVALEFVTTALNGPTRVGLPWISLLGFLRIRTNPRIYETPLPMTLAWQQVAEWVAAPAAWIVNPTDRHAEVMAQLIDGKDLSSGLVTDAHLAALAIEYGVAVASADSDFARFPCHWINPF